MATTHTLLSFDDLEFLLHKKDLTDLYGERCGTLNLVIDPYDLFLPDGLEDEFCDDPFNCCYCDVYNSIGTEYSYIDPPEFIHEEHCATNGSWPDGTPCEPILPPFVIEGTHHYYATKPGKVVSGILSKLGSAWDPDLQSKVDTSVNFVFRAESDGPSNPDVVTGEQGTVVQQQPAPAQTALTTLAAASTGKTVDCEWTTFFSYHTAVNWSTTEAQGKILFSQALSPELNPYLKHISSLYSTWSGGVDVRFTVSGSGVFGGKLAALIVPPGIEPVESPSMLQYPRVLFDARQTEPVIFTIPDIRKTLYHSMDDTDTTKLVIMVYNELINPYEQADIKSSCSITVETRPSTDFTFSLLKPPGSLLKHGSVPSDLIPVNSRHWMGNRWWTTIDGFVVQPRVFQSNRHFDFDSTTTGWSTPYFTPIEVTVKPISGSQYLQVTDAEKQLVPGIPDGWPDTTIPENTIMSNGKYAYTMDQDKENPKIKQNDTHFKGFYIMGNLMTRADNKSTNQEEMQRTSVTLFATNAKMNSNNKLEPSHKISSNSLLLYNADNREVMTKTEVAHSTMSQLGYVLVDEKPIGSESSKVVRIATLPEAFANGGNFPVFFRNKIQIGYFDRQHTECWNSQILMTSRRLAENHYSLPPDSLAIYRITDSSSSWFDLGIDHDGFSYVGASTLPEFNFPLTATFMGVQLAKIKLASKVKIDRTTV
ncbi:major structural protein precursor [Rabbit vesivirus]|uniref:major structural protein precursor n=1 Tax=Rabbit vesivirus TaxID=303317 RepID=UPI000051D668|nr:major structural protein precursor [Rabbit vesivirus]CAI29269.1 major structural protein precursor [Rabbit vesivirus]